MRGNTMAKRYNHFFFFLIGFVFLFGCEKKEDAASEQPQFTDMESYIEYKCTMCHFSERIFKKKRKPKEWMQIVRRMRNRNQHYITAEDEQKLLKYFINERSIPEGSVDTRTD